MKRKLMGFVAAMLSMFLLFGTVETSAATTKENGATVYQAEYPDSLLGMAADFGIFADKVELTGHVASNVACNSLKYNDMHTTANGYFYAKEWLGGNSIGSIADYVAYFDTATQLDVYVGSQYELKQEADGSWLILENGRQIGNKVQKSGVAQKIEFHNEDSAVPFIDIEKELGKLNDVAASLYQLPADGAKYERKGNDDNNKTITVTKEFSVLNLPYSEVKKQNAIYITGIKGTERNLIINVTGIPEGAKEFDTDKIFLDEKDAPNNAPETNAKYASQILWNFGNYNGTINIKGEYAGTILAPSATVNLCAGNIVGSVIAKKFTTRSKRSRSLRK